MLKQKETFSCATVSYDALAGVIGFRPNLHSDGSTAGDSIYAVQKSSLKECPRLASTEKHSMMGPAFRVSHMTIFNGSNFYVELVIFSYGFTH